MKRGIDSYSFRRYFGDIYPGLQDDPGVKWDMIADFLPHTKDVTTRPKDGSSADRFSFFPSCPTGSGLVDFEGVLRELVGVGFKGSLAIELDLIAPQWVDRPEEELVAQSLDYLRGLIADQAVVAEEAR
jgi:hypothetical protein